MLLNNADLFTASEMTDAVNKLPLTVSRFGGMFESKGVRTTQVAVEIRQGRIVLISDQERGSEPEHIDGVNRRRQIRYLTTTHLAQADVIAPEDLQDVRAFGSTELVSAATVINDRMSVLKRNLDMTLEWHRLGAVKGVVLDADGRTVLHNIYDTFGVTPGKADIKFPATISDTENQVLTSIVNARRKAEAAMQGNPYGHFECIIGSDAYDMLTSHRLVREYWERWMASHASFGDNDWRTRGFPYGGIVFREASEVVGGRQLVDPKKGHLYPVGPGIWKTYNAPADWMETVNTVGLPFYARMDEKRRSRGYDLEVQSNPLTLCLFPEALVELTFKAA